MAETLAQIISLTAYGNDYMQAENILSDFDSSNTTFQFCHKVDFSELKKTFGLFYLR